MAYSVDAAIAASRCIARSASRCSVMSRNTRTTPDTFPPASRTGAPLSAIGVSVPSRAIRIVWLARPATTPSRITRRTGLSTGVRLSSFTIRNTSSTGRPSASAVDQPVSRSATGLRNVTRPSASVARTPSPMLRSVVRSCSSLSRASDSAAALPT